MYRPGKGMRYAAVGLEFVSAPIGAILVGYYLDSYFHTGPWIMMALFLAGVAGGFVRLIIELKSLQDKS